MGDAMSGFLDAGTDLHIRVRIGAILITITTIVGGRCTKAIGITKTMATITKTTATVTMITAATTMTAINGPVIDF